ncbi:hypothetical protein EDB85DRAFT_2148135 [Lactarius pseudohatsudake]|nr:hypothetical protein EDB85DRAFT_2148135 [Lactarius pseudohatsudake]
MADFIPPEANAGAPAATASLGLGLVFDNGLWFCDPHLDSHVLVSQIPPSPHGEPKICPFQLNANLCLVPVYRAQFLSRLNILQLNLSSANVYFKERTVV